MANRALILLELNEINFDIVRMYVDTLQLKNFSKIFSSGVVRTLSENSYEKLEPWIQWVSVHTGLTAAQHGVFRLGDIVQTDIPQFFELVESRGYSVGAISPMNTANRLCRPKYFIPDPWTRTGTDGSIMSKALSAALAQTVNDNSAGRISLKSLLTILLALVRFADPRHYFLYMKLAFKSRGAQWRKALFLDLFLHDLHTKLFRKHRPNFSTLFLNAAAHIQHHYFFNSPYSGREVNPNPSWYIRSDVDPIAEMLSFYDSILGDLLRLNDVSILIATGLTQIPYDLNKYYYRLNDHSLFLKSIGLEFKDVLPRMTRDFEIQFDSPDKAKAAEILLLGMHLRGESTPIFGEIDNRGSSLFVTLTYPYQITEHAKLELNSSNAVNFSEFVVFVAVKNGMHASHGFACGLGEIANFLPADNQHVKHLHTTVLNYFPVREG